MQYRLSNQQKQEVCIKYERGQNSSQLSQEYGISSVAIIGILRRRGVEIRPQTLAQRKHKLWHEAFDKLTPKASYWIGFLFADGTVTRRTGSPELALVLSEKDKKHIEKFKKFLKSEHKITEVNQMTTFGQQTNRRFSVRSERLAQRLEDCGLKPFLESEVIPELFNSRDFWRGVVDGDGHIGIVKNRNSHYPKLELVGGQLLMEQFSDYIYRITGKKAKVCRHKSIFRVSYLGKTVIQIVEHLYLNSPIHLDRKYNAAKNILNKAVGQTVESVKWNNSSCLLSESTIHTL